MVVDLRTYVFVDALQLQMASYIAMVSRGYFPVADQACCFVEISPGIEINRLTDIAVKATDVKPGIQVVERLFGMLEVHSHNQGDARQAGQAILNALDLQEENRMKPSILTSQLIKNMDPHHAQLINRMRYGNMIIKGDTLYILEIEPAGYAYYAANEAEKAAHINIIEVRGFGRYGRIYIAGEEAEVLVAKDMVEKRLQGITGREPQGQAE
jgi:hypothetical protein